MKTKNHLLILIAVLLAGASAVAAGPKIAWEETFDGPDCLEKARFYVWPRYGKVQVDESLVIKEFKDGVFRYGLKHEPTHPDDWLNLVYGNIVWGHKNWPEWGPFDLKEFPIVEIKWRGDPFSFWYGKETADGKKIQDYTHLSVDRTETDAQGREWNISIFRAAADSAVPGPHTAVKLLGINPMFTMGKKDQVLELASIRVRGFTEEEAQREANVIEMLSEFPQGRWRGLDTFFPWGVYGTGFLRGMFEWWAGDYEGAYGIYSRNHVNFIATNYEIELSRVGGRALGTDNWSAAVDSYARAVAPLIEAARATGLKRAADMRYLDAGRDPEDGYAQLLPIAKRIAQEVHPDDDVIVAWTLADEPGVDKMLAMASCIRALRETDPHKRPGLVVFNAPQKMAPYVPYLGLNYWDNYPVLGSGRNPWNIRKLAREYRKLLPSVPMWPVLAAFETRPPAGKAYIRPSDAEMRLMAYLSIAEGAKGIVWFHGYGSGRDEHLLERTGHARGGMLATLSELGERLIPIGQQLLATDPVDDVGIEVTQLTEGDGEHVVTVSVLAHRSEKIHYLVVVNEDIDHTRKAKAIILGEAIPSEGRGVYDLYALDGVDLTGGGNAFAIAPLAGGDARIYAVCSEGDYGQISAKILCAKAIEEVRSLMPDLAIARRWGVNLEDVDANIDASKRSAEAGHPGQALTEARIARSGLLERIGEHSELAAVRRALRDIQTELTEVLRIAEVYSLEPRWWTKSDHPMCIPNPTLLEEAKRYFEVGRRFRDCYTKYVKGEREGLWTDVRRTRLDCLTVREDILGFLRKKLEPAEEPAP